MIITQAKPNTHSSFSYPNKMRQIILQAMNEVLGCSNAQKVLKQARLAHLNAPIEDAPLSFRDLGRMQRSLEKLYGARGGRGVALRSGRACFKYSLRELGPSLGLNDMAFRLLPFEAKLRQGIQIFAEVFNHATDQHVWIEENDSHFLWHVESCKACGERQADHTICDLLIGMLQEAVTWMSAGKQFNVDAKGDPTCTIQIDKRPID